MRRLCPLRRQTENYALSRQASRHPTGAELITMLREGRTGSRALTDEALARIADPAGEGKRAFLKVYVEQARAAAAARRIAGAARCADRRAAPPGRRRHNR
jgi:hypothetical protein